MLVTPTMLKWVMRFYPPFLFQRIWVQDVAADFKSIDIKIKKSFLNLNANKTIFGGTIFSALDPIHSILLDCIFKQRGIEKTVAWLKSAQIQYLKPGTTDLCFRVSLKEHEIVDALEDIKHNGKVVKTFKTEIFDMTGLKCVECQNEIYIRDLNFDFSQLNDKLNKEVNITA